MGTMKVTALRVTSRRGLRVSITRLKRAIALCSVQKRRTHRAMAVMVLAVRRVCRGGCLRTKGRKRTRGVNTTTRPGDHERVVTIRCARPRPRHGGPMAVKVGDKASRSMTVTADHVRTYA